MAEPVDGATRVLLDASPNAVVGVDDAGVIGYLNERAVELFGYPRERLLGAAVEQLVPPELRPAHSRIREAFQADPAPRPRMRLTARRANGAVFPVEISLTPVGFPAGRWVFAAVMDLSDRAATESQLDQFARAYRTLAETNQAMVRSRDPAGLFDAACRIAVQDGGYLGAWVGRPDDTGHVTVAARSGVLDDYISHLNISVDADHPEGNGPVAVALREERSYYIADFRSDVATVPWRARADSNGIRASASLPLRRRGAVIAALTLYSAIPGAFGEHMRALLEGMAENLSYALDGMQSASELREAVVHRSELLDRLVAAQESERAQIAADVHDDSVQALAAVDLHLGALQRRIQRVAPELDDDAAIARRTLTAATERLRALLFDLEPVDSSLPLAQALTDLSAALFEGHAVVWSVTGDVDADLPRAERRQAVRIVKEALTNVRQHASASSVEIALRHTGNGVEITVADDGIGIDSGAVTSLPGHRGITGMHDRAEVSGGWLRIEAREKGTTVRCWLPDPQPSGRPVVQQERDVGL